MTMFREVENKDLPCHLFGYIMDAEENNAFFDTMDIYFAALGDGSAELEVPVSKMHYNTAEVVHSGVFAGLMDATMGMAVLTKNKVASATSMSSSYLKPASKGDVLKAEAKVTLIWYVIAPVRLKISAKNCLQPVRELFRCRLPILYSIMRRNCVKTVISKEL